MSAAPYDAEANAMGCYALWIRTMRRAHVLAGRDEPIDDEERGWVEEAAGKAGDA